MTPRTGEIVMVVEDDDDIRDSLVELLESWGMRPMPALGAGSALRMLQEGCNPTVILLDLRMPGVSGWEFRRIQMAEPSFARIPVVVITALGGDPESTKAQMGDVIWLPKPFSAEALADTLAHARAKAGNSPDEDR